MGVQGVFYRESMRRQAAHLGIAGWVRNRRDGTVEAALEGPPDAVDAMIRWAGLGTLTDAEVARVEVAEDAGGYSAFEVLATF